MLTEKHAGLEAPTNERRSTPRQKTFLKGIILFNNRKSSADCVIRDLTDHGARLHFSAAVITPDVIELQIPNKDQILQAHVRWRKGDECGVSFSHVRPAEAASPAQAGGDANQRIEQLEAEVAKMHRQIVELRNEMRKLRGD
jgi:hypothetical protein